MDTKALNSITTTSIIRVGSNEADDSIHDDQSIDCSEYDTGKSLGLDSRNRPESFFADPVDPERTARALASDVICRLLIWMADGRTLDERGLRACVALYCIRPDLVDGATLEEIGEMAGRTRQAVHKLATSFRDTTNLTE